MANGCELKYDCRAGLPPVARVETGDRPATAVGAGTIDALCDEAETADAGLLLIRSEALVGGRVDELPRWEAAGFRKLFVRTLGRPLALRAPLGEVRPAEGLSDGLLERYRVKTEAIVGQSVELNEPCVEHPYIHSFDLVSPEISSEQPQMRCFAHYHPLSAGLYVEKLELAPERRNQGAGTRIVAALMALAVEAGVSHVYLVAKQEAERFWRRQRFAPLGRLNLRARARRREALRKQPGWEVARVAQRRLQQPVWYYRNHPADDIDLVRALSLYGASL